MQTRTYGDLFKLIQSLAGVGSFAESEQDDIANLINRRFLQAFNESPIWPRYIVSSEKRDILALTLSGATASTSTTVNQNYKLLGANTTGGLNVYQGVTTNTVIIYNTGTAWRVDTAASAAEQASGTFTVTSGTQEFIEADTIKKDQVTDVETFTPRAGTDSLLVQGKNLIPYEQTGKTTIGSFNRIHRKQAFLNNLSIEYDFFVDFTGANILNITSSTDNSAFVTYKQQFTPFSVGPSTDATVYTDSTVEVPGEFFAYLAHATYADFLRMDGQTEKAFAEEQRAEISLALELEKIDIISNNNTVNKRFSTYVNRQSR
jgi:hypothetical protein